LKGVVDMSIGLKSSSIEQIRAEEKIFALVEKSLNVSLEKNPKLYLANNECTYIQPDFYSAKHCIIGEIFAHIGKPKKAQDNKIANDILKMLLLETGRGWRLAALEGIFLCIAHRDGRSGGFK
jgi:hypothetical protein